MKSKKELKEIAKRDANRFCNRNRIYERYDSSVADMIKKLYITTYLRARHQIMSEINQKTLEEVFEEGIRFPNFKVMKTESFRFKGSEPNVAELPVSKEKELWYHLLRNDRGKYSSADVRIARRCAYKQL